MAARFLRAQGYRILGRNVKLGKYEIDIIAQEGDTVAFVEVKTRERKRSGAAGGERESGEATSDNFGGAEVYYGGG